LALKVPVKWHQCYETTLYHESTMDHTTIEGRYEMREIKKTDALHIQVYQIVKEKILNGEFQPNERLVESKLAEQIGVSRGTVREAIRMLTKDELIEQRDSYLFVYNPSQNDIIDIYECRRSLELLSVRLAAQKITDDQLIDLNRIIKYSKEALEKNDTEKLTRLNQQFHDTITLSSQNKQLIQLFEVISTKVLYIRNCLLKGHTYSFPVLINDHEQILQALKERDPIKAETLMNNHIETSLKVVHSPS